MSKSNIDKYQIKSPHEHVLLRPDMYMDTIKNDKLNIYIYDEKKKKIVLEEKTINSGLYKIFDEILVNASDQSIRDDTCNVIKVNIDDNKKITIYNNGNSKEDQIPIQIHPEKKIYIPELIFGNLLSGSNFDDTEERIVGGKNGCGAKLTNIYSKFFEIEILNTNDKKKYIQTYTNNMYSKNEPIITKNNSKEGYTKISFIPDYERFECNNLTNDMFNLFKKRTYDIAGTTNRKTPLKVYFNDELINIPTFEDYIKMFYDETETMPPLVYKTVNERWSIGIVFDDKSGFKNVSYVNRISTFAGGTHVSYIMDQIIEKITEKIKKKHKNLVIKPSLIKDNITIFINSTIGNPDFDSQSKKKLNTKSSEWIKSGYPCVLDENFIKELCKTGIVEEITRGALSKQDSELNKMNSKKSNSVRGIPNFNDALYAGTNKSNQCTLVLVEGLSAKSYALAITNSDFYGIYPLKGKMLNPRGQKGNEKILNNEEITNIINILGLKHNTEYLDTKKLRYGKILILTDQDLDGFHIKGLVMNIFHMYWRSLLKIDFIQSISTPILKAHRNNNELIFYNLSEYKNWEKTVDINKYKIKYYKGLGTSTNKEAKEDSKDLKSRVITYSDEYENSSFEEMKSVDSENNILNETDKYILLAFAKKKEDERKDWLKVIDEDDVINSSERRVTFKDFINKELKHFSCSDNRRSIPDLCDGLKPSQRKVIFSAFKRNLDSEIKVAQFAGYVSEHSAYHHGEVSLHGTIIGMAQNFCGSNNINLLTPAGQFGTRLFLGKDHASARYIFTKLNEISHYIFKKDDESILKNCIDDGDIIEPERYYPILPMVLVNGCDGIGTGYSTNIPSHNPLDIIKNIKLHLENKELDEMMPWYYGFKGTIEKKDSTKFLVRGSYEIINENTIHVTEIPFNISIEAYREKLDKFIIPEKRKTTKKTLKKAKSKEKENKEIDENEENYIIEDHHQIKYEDMDESVILISITLKNNVLQQLIKNDSIYKTLKLETTISISNMHLYENNIIKKYEDTNEILTKYCHYRLIKYNKRIKYIINNLENELNLLFYKKKYIQQVLDDEIVIKHQKKNDIILKLEELKYPKLSLNDKAVSYEYLTNFLLFSLTKEKIEELNNKYKEVEDKLNYYKNTNNKELWIKELDEFEEFYKNMCSETEPSNNKTKTKKNKKEKLTKEKNNKSIDDEDETKNDETKKEKSKKEKSKKEKN
jgi:DNA topoisomerase-2